MGLLTLPTIFSIIMTDRNRKCNILGTGEGGEVLEMGVLRNPFRHHHILKQLYLQVLVVITDKGSGLILPNIITTFKTTLFAGIGCNHR